MTTRTITNAMTVDVEEHFHVSAFAQAIPRTSWPSIESRVESNTVRMLEIFEEASVSATFFVLGWVAERSPRVVRKIADAGHEVACHGYSHQLIYRQGKDEFTQETRRAKKILEDITGTSVNGYRAASFSITRESLWATEVLAELGFRYDSSIVPVRHDYYGIVGAEAFPHFLETETGTRVVEFPPSTCSIGGHRVPVGGGGYFRLYPYWLSRYALERINRVDEKPFTFYLHPWEIDTAQPRVRAGWKATFRHYNNIDKCEFRLRKLLKHFKFDTMAAVLEQVMPTDTGKTQHLSAAR